MTINKNSGSTVRLSRAATRALLASGLATVFAAGLGGSASAYEGGLFSGLTAARPTQATPVYLKRRHARSRRMQTAEPGKPKGPEKLEGPLELVISIRSQKITLYANGEPAGTSIISTGVPGHATPMGVFSVIEKDRYHHSNIYSGAPMPYMQRITWSGVALHQGMVTGHPASHGCIRLPQAFAQRLWGITQVGVRVIIAPEDVSPVAISDVRLFAMTQKPAPVAEIAPAAKIRLATNAEVTDAPTLPASAETAPATQPAAVEPVAAQPTTADTATPAAAEPATTQSIAAEPATTQSAEELATTPPTFAVPATTQSTAAEPANTVGPIEDGATVTETIRAVQAKEAAEKARQVEAAQAAEHAAEIANAKSPAFEKSKLLATAKQYPERPGAITVFISRSLGKLFVRRGFWPVFETPVKIAQPDRPFGTHVFTALEPKDDKSALRWNVVSLPNANTVQAPPMTRAQRRAAALLPQPPRASRIDPSDVLGRITIPDEALERITEMMTPGASLIISDLGLSGETNRGTDFIIVMR